MNIARKTLARAATALTAAAVLTSTVAVVSAGPALAQATSLHQFLAATWKFQQDMKTMTYGPSLSHARLIAVHRCPVRRRRGLCGCSWWALLHRASGPGPFPGWGHRHRLAVQEPGRGLPGRPGRSHHYRQQDVRPRDRPGAAQWGPPPAFSNDLESPAGYDRPGPRRHAPARTDHR